jgi:hypothetical protein
MDGKNPQMGPNPAPSVGFLPGQGQISLEMGHGKSILLYGPLQHQIRPILFERMHVKEK